MTIQDCKQSPHSTQVVFGWISDTLDRLTEVCYVATTVAFTLVMLLGVFFRYVLNASLFWSDELALMLFMWAAFLSIATGYRHDKHVKVDFFVQRLSPALRHRCEVLAEALSGVYLVCLLVSGAIQVQFAATTVSPALGWSQGLHFSAIPVCAALMLVHWARNIATTRSGVERLAILVIVVTGFTLAFVPIGNYLSLVGIGRFITVFAAFFVPLMIGVPVALVVGLVSTIYVACEPSTAFGTGAQQTFLGLETVVLVAVPLLILSGTMLHEAGAAKNLVDFAQFLVGRVRGGLAASNVLASYIFGDISGSSVSDTAAIGSIMIPEMKQRGYKADFCAALQGASGTLGMMAPLSITLLMYSAAVNVSVSRMAVATIIPATLITISFMGVAIWHGYAHKYPKEIVPYTEALPRTLRAIPAILALVLIIGGVLGGIFTPAEVGSILVIYVAIIAVVVYGIRSPRRFYRIIIDAGYISGMTLLLVSTSNFLGFVLALENTANALVDAFAAVSTSQYFVLFSVNIVFIILGMFLEAPAMIFGFLPSFMPLIMKAQIDYVHWGVLFVANMGLGMIVPPIAVNLFISTAIAGVRYDQAVRACFPFIAIMMLDMVMIAIFPHIPLILPHLIFGYPME